MYVTPLVSVIIPTYNNADVISQAIDCCLEQTYTNLEIIVVDDGSIDATEQFLAEKYNGRVTCIRQENKGAGGARNTGIRHASGKYLQFLDADDLLDPDKIRIQVEQLQQIPGMVLSYCDYVRCDLEDITVTYARTSPRLQSEKPLDDLILKWETEVSIPLHCFLFDAALFKECGIAFDESLKANEDWECWINIFLRASKVVFVDKALVYYRIRSGSRCSNRLTMRDSWFAAIDKVIQKHASNRDLVEKLALRKKQVRYMYRDVSPLMIMLEAWPAWVKSAYNKLIPWRVQRLFD